MTRFSDEFLCAVGEWQQGWNEDKNLRLEITERLKLAIAKEDLPPEAFRVPAICYRMRYLDPHNPQNGGDFLPLFINGENAEGVASWTTDLDFAKMFRTKDGHLRVGNIAIIFGRAPTRDELVLNIVELWNASGFEEAVKDYTDRRCAFASALNYYRYEENQSEVVLNAPIKLSETFSFCDRVPAYNELIKAAGITTEAEEAELDKELDKNKLWPGSLFWKGQEDSLKSVIRTFRTVTKIFENHLG